MAEGFFDPAAASTAMAVTGMSWTEPVLIARKVHIAFVAVPGNLLRVSKSLIARRPRGVAAFTSPSILAAIFNTMEPIAGCSTGTSGNSRRSTGCRKRASAWTRPAFSARRIRPSQTVITPISPNDSVTADSAPFTAPSATSLSLLSKPPISTASRMSASQM